MMKLQTLPVQGEAKKVMVSNTFSFPSTCLRQTYRITSMLKRFLTRTAVKTMVYYKMGLVVIVDNKSKWM